LFQFLSNSNAKVKTRLNPILQSGTKTSVRERKQDLTLSDLCDLFGRRKMVIALPLAVILISAILYCIFSERRYRATGELQVQKESMDGLGLSSMIGDTSGATDALDSNITIQTEASILQSDTLALRVIKDLNLEPTSDFQPRFKLAGLITGLLSPAGPGDPSSASLEDSPKRRAHALLVFSKNLKVTIVPGTRLIDVSYTNPDPKVAAAVVNHLIQALADFSFQTRYNATSQASEWLGSQLSDLRKQSEDLQAKVVQLQRDSGVFTLGGGTETDGKPQGGTGIYSSVLDRLQQATASLTAAESNRILKRAIYDAAKSGDAELISGLAGNAGSTGMSAGLASSLSLIQNLRLQQATLQGQLDEVSAKFGPAYPKLDEIRGNLNAITRAIHDETQRIADRAQSDYEVSEKVEDGARSIFNQEKQDADRLNNKAIEYMIVRQEAEQSRELYETLLSHLKEAGVLEGLRSSNISVVDPARVPSKPAKPNVPLNLALALVAGLFFGCGGAIFVDIRDNKIRDLHELEAAVGKAPIGILPAFDVVRGKLVAAAGVEGLPARQLRGILALDEPWSPYIEALRALRTSLLLSRGGAPPKVILVTSSIASEGKTTLSVNLAILLAQHGKKVLLVDADLRRPMLHRILATPTTRGLSTLLAGQGREDAQANLVQIDNAPGLSILCSGPMPPYPSELLGSDQMRLLLEQWREQFDFIVFDGAPILPVTDSVILSNLVDSKLLVARFGLTEKQSIERSFVLLSGMRSSDPRVSVVVNGVEQSNSSYYRYYGYSKSSYHHSIKASIA
jgi:polysaccharide biosynthesis transport protein